MPCLLRLLCVLCLLRLPLLAFAWLRLPQAFEPWLSSHERALIVAIMERANWQKYKRTGANLVSELSIQIKRGVLSRNATVVDQAFQRSWSNIKVSPPTGGCMYEGCLTDGIQADRSYHQHGAQLLAGSYGAYLLRGIHMCHPNPSICPCILI
jgi:hypothetical protein